MANLRFLRDFKFEYGVLESISPLVRRIIARNPGPFTGPGTATYVVGRGQVALIDPGPAISSHVEAVLRALSGETISHLLITHAHADHWPAAMAIQDACGTATYGFGLRRSKPGTSAPGGGEERLDHGFVPDRALRDGDVIGGPDWQLAAVHTPGHTSDHLCFALTEERVLFSGDHVMGWSTSVIIPPDGDMRAYTSSLQKLLERDDAIYLPAHGPAITDPKPHVRAFLEHRRERRAAILERLGSGDRTIPEIVEAVYAGLPAVLRGAAAYSVLAHLIELVGSGEVECDGQPAMDRDYRLRK